MTESPENLVNDRWNERRKNLQTKLKADINVISARLKYVVENPKPEPFPVGAFNRLWGNQIWDNVLGYLDEHSDVTNAFFTCKSFQNLLKDKLEVKLLAKTLQILGETEHLHDDIDNTTNELIPPRFNCLGIRGVSRAWKNVADSQFFESRFQGDSWHLETYSIYSSLLRAAFYSLDDEICIEKAMECFSINQNQSQDNPPLRLLQVHGPQDENEDCIVSDRKFYEKLVRFLETHGHSVYYFVYKRQKFSRSFAESYEYLWRLLINMPNLKALQMEDMFLSDDDEDERSVTESMRLHPFPKLESLKYFYFECNCHALLNKIYTTCANLKSLCNASYSYPGWAPESASLPLEYYKEAFDMHYPHGERGDPIIMYPEVTWPLKVLHIIWGANGYDNARIWWPAINRFSETLCELRLHPFDFCYDEKPVIKKDTTLRLFLPHLKSLEIEMAISKGSISVDDLIPLKHLEILKWNCIYADEYDDSNNQIKLKGMERKMQVSNIWDYFPNLMELDIPATSCDGNDLKYLRRGSTLFGFEDGKLIKEEEIPIFSSNSTVKP